MKVVSLLVLVFFQATLAATPKEPTYGCGVYDHTVSPKKINHFSVLPGEANMKILDSADGNYEIFLNNYQFNLLLSVFEKKSGKRLAINTCQAKDCALIVKELIKINCSTLVEVEEIEESTYLCGVLDRTAKPRKLYELEVLPGEHNAKSVSLADGIHNVGVNNYSFTLILGATEIKTHNSPAMMTCGFAEACSFNIDDLASISCRKK